MNSSASTSESPNKRSTVIVVFITAMLSVVITAFITLAITKDPEIEKSSHPQKTKPTEKNNTIAAVSQADASTRPTSNTLINHLDVMAAISPQLDSLDIDKLLSLVEVSDQNTVTDEADKPFEEKYDQHVDQTVLTYYLLRNYPEAFFNFLTRHNQTQNYPQLFCFWTELDFDKATLFFLALTDEALIQSCKACLFQSTELKNSAHLVELEQEFGEELTTALAQTSGSISAALNQALIGTPAEQLENIQLLAARYGATQLHDVLQFAVNVDDLTLRVGLVKHSFVAALGADYPIDEVIHLALNHIEEDDSLLSTLFMLGAGKLKNDVMRKQVLSLLDSEQRQTLNKMQLLQRYNVEKDLDGALEYAYTTATEDRQAALKDIGTLLAVTNPNKLIEVLETWQSSDEESMKDPVFSLIYNQQDRALTIFDQSNNELLKSITADKYTELADDWQTMRDRVFLTENIDGYQERLSKLISARNADPIEALNLLSGHGPVSIDAKPLRRLMGKMVRLDSNHMLDWMQDQTGDIKEIASGIFVSRAALKHPGAAKRLLKENIRSQDLDWVMASLVRTYAQASDADRRKFSAEFGPIVTEWLCVDC